MTLPAQLTRPLLVSDLDGTLLNARRQVSEGTASAVNAYVGAGGLFTIATARMPHGCQERLAALDLRLPAVVMNGAAVYSFHDSRFLDAFPMHTTAVEAIERAVADVGADAFVYALDDGRLSIGVTSEVALEHEQYASVEARAAHGPFAVLGSADWRRLGTVIYVAIVGADDRIAAVAAHVAQVGGVRSLPYRNIYSGTDCLELASAEAGKAAAIEVVRASIDAESLVVFGDNHNDLDMIEAADMSLAPSDAVPEILAAVDVVLGPHDEDAVADALRVHFGGGEPLRE